MFERFKNFVNFNNDGVIQKNNYEFELGELFKEFNDSTFIEGLYRIHDYRDVEKWNELVTAAFPNFKGRFICFGYDWLGRQFAIDKKRIVEGKEQVLMFEPGTGEVLEIPCNIVEFHNNEIVEYHDACLASSFFKKWRLVTNDYSIKHNECVGYTIPLFLGGSDTVENIEKSDMDVYWTIISQLIGVQGKS